MNENKLPGEEADLTEAKIKEIAWNRYFPEMRFWTCVDLFGVLFVLAMPLLIFLYDKISNSRWTPYFYHYTMYQLIVFLIALAISLAGMFFIFTAKDKSRLEIVKWLSLAGAVTMCLAFWLFENELGGHVSDIEKTLYWLIFIDALLHIVSFIRVFKAYKNL